MITNAPFYVSQSTSPDSGRTELEIYNPGEPTKRVEPPFYPFLITDEDGYNRLSIEYGRDIVGVDKVSGRPLSRIGGSEKDYLAVSFKESKNIGIINKKLGDDDSVTLMNNRVPFLMNIGIIAPEFWQEHGYDTEELDIVTLDIEQASEHGFPKPGEPIVAIAAQHNDNEPVVFLANENTIVESDKIVNEFASWLDDIQPDIIVTYNGATYDLPVLSEHSERFKDYWFKTQQYDKYRNKEIDVAIGRKGIIHFDVYDCATLDQTLSGIKNKKLKTLGEWKIDRGELDPDEYVVIREDYDELAAMVGTERLAEYNRNDVKLTYGLFEIYFEQWHHIHNWLKIPFNQLFPLLTSTPGKYFVARSLWNQKIWMDKTNIERYPEIYKRQEVVDGDAKPFQGAISDCYITGRYSPVLHYDIGSMYPSIVISLGIGPDNLQLVEYRDELVEHVTWDRDTQEFWVPDEVIGKTLVMKKIGKSQIAEQMGELLEERLRQKQEKGGANTVVDGIKRILNSFYGLNPSRYTRYGTAPVGILITAMGRHLLMQMKEHVEENGGKVYELDTDGLYADVQLDPKSFENKLNRITQKYDGDPIFTVDCDTYKAGLFYKAKNYLLLKNDGTIKKKGVSFKGSNLAPIFNTVIQEFSEPILKNGYTSELFEKAKMVTDREYVVGDHSRLIMQTSMGKEPDDYDNNSVQKRLAEQFKQFHGFYPTVGSKLKYVKVKVPKWGQHDKYILLERYESEPSLYELDEDYYVDMVDRALSQLGIELYQQKSLTDF